MVKSKILNVQLMESTLLSGVTCTFEIDAGASTTKTPAQLAQTLKETLANGNSDFPSTEAETGKTVAAEVTSVEETMPSSSPTDAADTKTAGAAATPASAAAAKPEQPEESMSENVVWAMVGIVMLVVCFVVSSGGCKWTKKDQTPGVSDDEEKSLQLFDISSNENPLKAALEDQEEEEDGHARVGGASHHTRASFSGGRSMEELATPATGIKDGRL